MSKIDCNETTILLSQEVPLATDIKKDASSCKKSVLSVLVVVSGLIIFIFISLMIKWHILSQSVIVPSQFDIKNLQDKPIDGRKDQEMPDDCPECSGYGRGATAVQLGKAFPLYILAQIAWKDFTSMIFIDPTHMVGDNNELGYSNSLIPMYLSQNSCKYAIDYFEKTFDANDGNIGYQEKDCQYLDLGIRYKYYYGDCGVRVDICNYDLVRGEYEQTCDLYGQHAQSEIQIQTIMARILDYFFDNYNNILNDCYVSDIQIIKYISNGQGYSGLHSENYYIDGQEIIIDGNVKRHIDYVAIVFLNDNFMGGDLQFIGSNVINNVNAQTGNGVLFGGGLEYSHRVAPITNGHRYVVKIVFNKLKESSS